MFVKYNEAVSPERMLRYQRLIIEEGQFMEGDSRTRIRVNYSAYALVQSGVKGTVKGKVRDISIDALYVLIDPVFEIDEEVGMEIVLHGTNSELVIKVSAKVLRKDDDGVAFHFISPLEWWPVFTFFSAHSLDNTQILLAV
jgi:PilZ domain-containing protein